MMKSVLLFASLLLTTSCTTHLISNPVGSVIPLKVRSFTLQEDVVYTPQGWPQALQADVYTPSGDGPWPGVLLIHGGSWTSKDRRTDMDSIAERLAHRGYVVMNATYRLAPKYLHPAQLEDLQQALLWMRANAARLNLRADRIATFGYSAGGHLAALLGALDVPASLRVQAVVAGGAPVDLRKFPDSQAVTTFLGGPLVKRRALYTDASPVCHISPDDPPVFLYHGSMDVLVPTDQAKDYYAALIAAGVPVELLWQNGLGHVPAFLLSGPAVRRAIDFLDRELRQ
jgi:acetyl esterase/lipase